MKQLTKTEHRHCNSEQRLYAAVQQKELAFSQPSIPLSPQGDQPPGRNLCGSPRWPDDAPRDPFPPPWLALMMLACRGLLWLLVVGSITAGVCWLFQS
jgi:hypothetical protein